MIVFPCPECAKELKVADDLAGKRGRCPFCRAKVNVPGPAADGQNDLVGAGAKEDAQATAPPTMSGDSRTLAPPRKSGVGEAKTLTPAAKPSRPKQGAAKPSSSKLGAKAASDAKTLLPAGKQDDTVNPDGAALTDPAAELTEFLEPAKADGELGRLGKYRVLNGPWPSRRCCPA
jgi:hypothetical protein